MLSPVLLGIDDDIDSFSGANQAINKTTPNFRLQSTPSAVPHENLGDSLLLRELQDCLCIVKPMQNFDLGSKCASVVHVLIQGRLPLLREGPLLYVNHIEFALESVRVATAAFQHARSIDSGAHANQNALLHGVRLIHPMRAQIVLKLAIDN